MKRTLLGLALLGIVLAGAGCSRVIGEGAGLVLGAKPNVVVVDHLPTGTPLGPVTIERFTSAMQPGGQASWLASLATYSRQKMSEERELATGRRPVKVSGELVHLEGAGLIDKAFGPKNEVVVRVTVRDANSGQVMGVANVLGRARGETSSSEEDLCKAFAEGLAKWLKGAGH